MKVIEKVKEILVEREKEPEEERYRRLETEVFYLLNADDEKTNQEKAGILKGIRKILLERLNDHNLRKLFDDE